MTDAREAFEKWWREPPSEDAPLGFGMRDELAWASFQRGAAWQAALAQPPAAPEAKLTEEEREKVVEFAGNAIAWAQENPLDNLAAKHFEVVLSAFVERILSARLAQAEREKQAAVAAAIEQAAQHRCVHDEYGDPSSCTECDWKPTFKATDAEKVTQWERHIYSHIAAAQRDALAEHDDAQTGQPAEEETDAL